VAFGPRTTPATAASTAANSAPASAQPNPSPQTTASTKTDAAPAAGEFALESKGYIIPKRQILVSPQVNGRLTKVSFEEGQRVEKGDILAEIEQTEFKADYLRAAALLAAAKQRLLELETGSRPEEISQAEAELAETRAQLPQAEAEWRRNHDLLLKRVVSESAFQQAEAQYRSMLSRIERLTFALKLLKEGPRVERIAAAQAEVEQAKAELSKAQWRLDNCTVRSPISGTILKKNAEEGNIVNPIAFNGSFSLCEMADLADLEVELDIQERDVSRVYKGQPCEVRCDAWPDRVYYGEVSRLMPIADRAKGSVPVRVKLQVPADEEGVYLKPEMGATVAFLNRRQSGQLAPRVPVTRGASDPLSSEGG
jgi:multidrug resistance efflux pump